MIFERLVLASSNSGKLAELRVLLGDRVGKILTLAEAGVESPEEPHSTFVENALAKARNAAQSCGCAALADDSGICVDELEGLPGVQSARFVSTGDDEDNNDMLLEKLEGVENRRAHYHCSVVLFRHATDPSPLIGEGRWHGTIAKQRRGSSGFGYDPLFLLDGGRTAAELDPAEKNTQSHRAIALRNLLAQLA